MAELLPHSGIMKEGTHILPIRVYYEDTDAGGIVYYANYLKYMERGRTEMLQLLKVDQEKMLRFQQGDDVKFVVRHLDVDYYASAVLGDCLTVETRLVRLGGASLVMKQTVCNAARILVQGMVRIAVLGPQDNIARLPAGLKARLQKIVTDNQEERDINAR